ncbi:hypothetical protein SAMN05428989_3440 [Pseudoxanthomonas sp. GM95]|uniref:hypothetical protein n=1 Tax=Pseudoxanthomonas sp. GM95 TaxID=1881043 RepID=UPI0008D34DA1|nr:hypothetical protein [Pseudoxanthomonas sp. GM95]SEM23144.1 hypothetical protein SAMN05428989_3440 [Pseudoxanthomonas sp. GM95]
MLLLEVIRWGNDAAHPLTGGPDGPDTCFLVQAHSVESAAALVDRQLSLVPHTRVAPHAAAVYLLGNAAASETKEQIVRGPYLQPAYRYGWRHWYRLAPEEPWRERVDD